jgi:hypothetical protein
VTISVPRFMRLISPCGLTCLLLVSVVFSAPLGAQTSPQDDADHYIAPAGAAPPVAPPLRKGSPLDHLTNDPKWTVLPVGYREGNTSGPPYGIGHRHIDEMEGQGWGWIHKTGDDWDDAKWVALQETLGVAVAPHRKLASAAADNDWEFYLWGRYTNYKAYDPRLDELLPVFILEGYQVIGPANPLRIKVGPPGRIFSRPSGASSRQSRPISTDHGID